ncbi:MAG: hypothetical protein QOD29_2507 [Alphaproteobacteria bacterium]|nr:hypothetical protein [Alphaproteobacteria bacterium]
MVPLDVAVDVRLSGSFGQNRVRWPARPRVRLAKIAHIGRRRLGFVRPPCIPATGTPRVRLAKVLQLAPPGVAEKARDPPPLLICLRVRIRLTIRISLAAAQARNTAARPAHVTVRAAIAPPQSHIRKRCGRGTISLSSVRCERRCSIKCPDGAFAPREGTGFVTVERHGARKRCPIQGLDGKQIGARAAHPRHIHFAYTRCGRPSRTAPCRPPAPRWHGPRRQSRPQMQDRGLPAGSTRGERRCAMSAPCPPLSSGPGRGGRFCGLPRASLR